MLSFLLCGFVTVAGKRRSVPTMVLSRAALGVRGNRLPSAISWVRGHDHPVQVTTV